MKKTALLLTVSAVFAFLVQGPPKFADGYGNSSWGGDQIEEVMEDMQRIMRKARRADSAEELLGLFERFREHLIEGIEIGETLENPRKEDYLNGMEDTLDLVEEAIEAAETGNFEEAKEYVKKLRNKKKRYHEKLDVDD